jgi:membrane-bound lytic murein transglycosylase A
VPLTAGHSLAVDRNVVPLGTPVWLQTTLPDGSPLHRLMVAQDTGGAIRGPVRADVFFGTGDTAEQLAGNMKQRGEMFVLLPRDTPGRESDR